MTENAPPSAGGGASVAGSNTGPAAGIPYYEKQRQHLRQMITRKRELEKRLVSSLVFLPNMPRRVRGQ